MLKLFFVTLFNLIFVVEDEHIKLTIDICHKNSIEREKWKVLRIPFYEWTI